jgi:hypothetical protein
MWKTGGGKQERVLQRQKNVTGRQLARVSAVPYREAIWSEVYPGNRHTLRCLQPAVLGAENALELAPERHPRVLWRVDGGAGSDEQLRWLLSRQYQIMAKGMSNRRAEALARQVTRWDVYRDVWLGWVDVSLDLGRPVQILVKKRLKDDKFCHSYYVTTLKLPSKGAFMACYDDRGGAEVEQFRGDKSGLRLEARRKQRLPAQLGLVLLTDLAHNLLAHFHHTALIGSSFENFGPKRIVRDLLNIPGRLLFEDAQLKSIALQGSHPYAEELLFCLVRYCQSD